MAELIHEHMTHVRTPEGRTYIPRTYAAQQSNDVWEAWLEFEPIGGGPRLRTDRETSQATREALETWASGLEASYFQGAFARARIVVESPSDRDRTD
jgi:hypothetical protein